MSRGWFLYMLDSNSVCELCGYFPKAVAHIVDSGAKSKPDSLQALLCTDLWLRPTECSGSRVGHHRLALRNDPRGNQLGMQRRIRGEADTDGRSAARTTAQRAVGQDRPKMAVSSASDPEVAGWGSGAWM